MQILYPMGHLNIMLKAALFASIVDIIVLVGLVQFQSQNAAALAYLLAEITATVTEYVLGRKYLPIIIKDKTILNYLGGSLLMGAVLWGVSMLNLNNVMMTIVMIGVGATVYGIVLMLSRDPLYLDVKQTIENRIK